MNNHKSKKPYWGMTAAELQEATRQYDEPFSAEKTVTPPSEESAKLRRFKRKMGRPRKGEGCKQIAVTIERRLLRKTDAFARRSGMSRSAVIAAGIEKLLGARG